MTSIATDTTKTDMDDLTKLFQQTRINEAQDYIKKRKVAVMNFGRLNPPTRGHYKLLEYIADQAKLLGGKGFIFLSASQNYLPPHKGTKWRPVVNKVTKSTFYSNKSNENPLSVWDKMNILHKFPKIENLEYINPQGEKGRPYRMDRAAEFLKKKGYTDIYLVVGTDRFEQLKDKGVESTWKLTLIEHPRSEKLDDFTMYSIDKNYPKKSLKTKPEAISGTQARAAAAEHAINGISGIDSMTLRQAEEAIMNRRNPIHQSHGFITFKEYMPNILNNAQLELIIYKIKKGMLLRPTESYTNKHRKSKMVRRSSMTKKNKKGGRRKTRKRRGGGKIKGWEGLKSKKGDKAKAIRDNKTLKKSRQRIEIAQRLNRERKERRQKEFEIEQEKDWDYDEIQRPLNVVKIQEDVLRKLELKRDLNKAKLIKSNKENIKKAEEALKNHEKMDLNNSLTKDGDSFGSYIDLNTGRLKQNKYVDWQMWKDRKGINFTRKTRKKGGRRSKRKHRKRRKTKRRKGGKKAMPVRKPAIITRRVYDPATRGVNEMPQLALPQQQQRNIRARNTRRARLNRARQARQTRRARQTALPQTGITNNPRAVSPTNNITGNPTGLIQIQPGIIVVPGNLNTDQLAENMGNNHIGGSRMRKKGGAHLFRTNQLIQGPENPNRFRSIFRIIEIIPPQQDEIVMGDRMIVELQGMGGIRLDVHANVLWDAGWRPLLRTNSTKSGAGRKNKTRKKMKKGGAYSKNAIKLMKHMHKKGTRKKYTPHVKIIQQAYRDYIKRKRESDRMTNDQWNDLKNKYSNMSYENMMDEDY
jgi:hypothetical protein